MRQFILAGFAVLATLGAGDVAEGGEGVTGKADEALSRFEFAQVHMGTRFRIVLYAGSENAANLAATAAMQRIEDLDNALSDYKPESELSRLSAASPTTAAVAISDDLWNVLFRSQQLARQTDGAFDVTIGPHSRLWRRARRRKELPPNDLLDKARASVGHRHLRVHSCNKTAELLASNMRLDLGAIAKGYAADEALAVLREHGIGSAMIDAAGDIVVSNAPSGKESWRVAIASIAQEKDGKEPANASYLSLNNASIATSGDLYQHLEIDGKRYSHIIDPRTGVGISGQTSVTIIAPDGMTADSLASAVSVMGRKKGFAFLQKMPKVACRFAWIDDNGKPQVRDTKNFPAK